MPLNTSDFIPGPLSGSATLFSKGSAFSKTVTIDGLPEGNEKFVAKLRKYSITGEILASSEIARINDTSQATAGSVYNLSASSGAVAEGGSVVITLSTLNVASGTTVPYAITGITSADISALPLVGTFTVNSAGLATATLTLALTADNVPENNEVMTVTLTGITPITTVSVTVIG